MAVAVFDSLGFIALVLLSMMLISVIMQRKIHRNKTWFSLMVSWMIYTLSFLLFIGEQFSSEPPFGFCLFQAALIHACPAL